jgi:ligand-binding SRPBCC domain-containing protein
MPRQTHVDESIEIAATPETVYHLVATVDDMARFSPECTGATVREPGRPLTVGDRFTGHNRRNALRRWSTHCTVIVAEPGREFAFTSAAIGLPIATWRYRFEALETGGTRVTETWDDNRGQAMRAIAVVVSGIRDRATHNRQGMRTTLRRLKAHLEDAPAATDPRTADH